MENIPTARTLWKRIKLVIMSEWHTFALVTVGTFFYALGVSAFTLPYRFPDAGVTGIAVLLKYTLNFPPSVFILAANVFLLLWGWRELSKRFVFWTTYSVIIFSVMLQGLEMVTFPRITDMFLVAVAAGIVKGIGGGMVFRTGASSGGTDVIVSVLRKRFGVEIGKYSFYLNLFILMASIGIVGIERMLYGAVATYISGQTTDSVLSSFDKRRLIFLVTDTPDEIKHYISEELHRGSTALYSEGGFSGEKKQTLMCLLTPRQVMELKRWLAKNYPKSFMAVTEASEVLGKGFKRWRNV